VTPFQTFLLDTSAILTLIEDEPGADRVEALLREHGEDVLLPFVVLLEATYITLREVGEAVAERRYALMRQLPCTEIWSVDEPTLLTAARFKVQGRISFADALIAAFAARKGAILVHKDPEYEALGDHVTLEALPYKATGMR
jgi:predicted nucleic acid-binding protein